MILANQADSDGRAWATNGSVILFETSLFFSWLYNNTFIYMHGKKTISQLRLDLTDENDSEFGPLDACVETRECYKNAKIWFVFVMPF